MRIEIRSDSVFVSGYVNVVQRESRTLPSPSGPFIEEIQPKTFERALMQNPNVDLLFNHDQNRKLGSTQTGEIQLWEDNIGLRAEATITDKEVMDKARSGELRGWSFGFRSLKDSWKTREDGMKKRIVEALHLAEVSLLDKTPAYIATSVESRGEEATLQETRYEEVEPKVEDKTEKAEETKQVEEKRENSLDFSNFEKIIQFQKAKGALYK